MEALEQQAGTGVGVWAQAWFSRDGLPWSSHDHGWWDGTWQFSESWLGVLSPSDAHTFLVLV